jgi:hypothetical protein
VKVVGNQAAEVGACNLEVFSEGIPVAFGKFWPRFNGHAEATVKRCQVETISVWRILTVS